MQYPSKLIENAVEALSTLPGIGRKTSLRLVLHLLQRDEPFTNRISKSLADMREKIRFCQICHNVSDEAVCSICANPRRDKQLVCIVESIRDVMAIEDTGQYNGTYHVLGGLISPIEGVGPEDIQIDSLIDRVKENDIKEIILAISPTIEGDTTGFYLSRKLGDQDIEISSIARGVSFGGELEYVDEVTLGRSIAARVPYTMNGQ